MNRVYDALPPESRTGRVQLLVPDLSMPASPRRRLASLPLIGAAVTGLTGDSSSKEGGGGGGGDSSGHSVAAMSPRDVQRMLQAKGPPAVALHLAATGDQGFGRRLRLSFPILQQVCGCVQANLLFLLAATSALGCSNKDDMDNL